MLCSFYQLQEPVLLAMDLKDRQPGWLQYGQR
jgi:hypothetical protein